MAAEKGSSQHLLEGLVRMVSRIGSYTDGDALCTIVRDLVAELGLEGAAVWRAEGDELRYECGAGAPLGGDLVETVEGEVRAEGDRIAWPLVIDGKRLGVLAVRGAMSETARMLAGMLAGRCAHILNDARRSQTQRALLEGLSHELRAPLQSLLGYVELLRGGSFGPLTEEQAEALDAVAAGAEKVLSVSRDVLQVARIDAGRDRPIVGEILLADLLRREVEDARPMAQAAGLALTLECPEDLVLLSDGAKVGRILTNLLSNAVKYTARGSIAVRAFREGRQTIIEVEDTGIGIPEDRREAVFREYVRLDSSREGTGLGLPIARRLATMLHGSLRALPGSAGGALLRLSLPPCRP